MKCLHITAKRASVVLDLLKENLPAGYEAESLLTAGAVWLGKGRPAPGRSLDAGETLRVYLRSKQSDAYRIDPEHVIFQDSALLVVYKPPGLPVQGDPASRSHHLSYGVWEYLGSPAAWKPAPITRIDQPVSGLVLFGACPESEKSLFALMRDRGVFKWYRTFLSGSSASGCRLVDLSLSHSGRSIRIDPEGKLARTLFIPGEKRATGQLYSAFPLTGRRHQIRVHAASTLAPIVGDTLYGGPPGKAEGISLCCVGLNLTLAEKRYRIRLPQRLDSESLISRK